ncbi:cytochrome P450 [Novosphingobium sp. JCM 18896]|uniref:cytochrome P450 n=1 Tax=Novosphingobium sp. JCM 18896 TaxID=2989731 RepID=UPI0022215991|nr:cytochrome P450 [Novosphingobium sp. JCM 18896]MCW1432281.1 cytochrome P450 [Novosphingobium sp. JCM 18896]
MDVLQMPEFPPVRSAADPLAPPPELLELARKGTPVKIRQWDGVEAWLITRFEDAKFALNDRRLSVDPRREGYPEKSAAYKQVLGQDRNLRTMDDPEHSQQKRMLARDFTVRRVQEMRPAIEQKVDGLIDAMLAKDGKAEIVADLALPVPTMVICELLGVPYADRDWFADKSQVCTSSRADPVDASEAATALYDYMESLIAQKDREPCNDLLSRLVVDQLRPGILTAREVIELARFVLIAGHETTANMIALSVLALLVNPDQRALMRGEIEPKFMANAVSEMLRYLSITHSGRRRVAVEDLEIGGQLIRAGEGLIIMNSVADRDGAMFERPDRLDLSRANAKSHLAFGGGAHRCVGAFLSEAELEIVHAKLWKRIPGLTLAVPFEDVEFYSDGSVYGLTSLPVRW